MTLTFGDHLSNALHAIKSHSGKKIGILQDEIGYAFRPIVTGDAVERWRYRKAPPSSDHLEQLAEILLGYKHPAHNRDWLADFLTESGHPYPEAVCERLFPVAVNSGQLTVPTPPHPPTFPSPHLSIPLPPHLNAYLPPSAIGFIGREEELLLYQEQAMSKGVAFISGMAGVGKTALMGALAARFEASHALFWHRFHDAGLDSFVRRLAGFLANLERSTLWEMLETARQSGIKPPPLEIAFDIIVAELQAANDQPLLLCLDDLQMVDDHPQLQSFLQRSIGLAELPTQFLITTRRPPTFLRLPRPKPLEGLSVQDTRRLLNDRAVELADPLVAKLHGATAGNGAFLTLSAIALQGTHSADRLIEQLETIDDVERFLLEEVDARLSRQEQRLMTTVALFGPYPGTREAIEAVLNQRNVRLTLRGLCDQYLLTIEEGEMGRTYQQHQIVQAFYAGQPSRSAQRQMHQQAADFFLSEEVDYFRAAWHTAHSADGNRTVEIGTSNLWEIINQGHAAELARVFEKISAGGLSEPNRFEWEIALARLDLLSGEIENGREQLGEAAKRLQSLPENEETHHLKARVSLGMAELLERHDPPEALAWGQRGLTFAAPSDQALRTRLVLVIGAVQMHMGNFGEALEAFHDGLELCPPDQPALKVEALRNIGAAYFNTWDLDKAEKYTDESLELSLSLRNHLLTSEIYHNLGPIKYMRGDWAGGIAALEQGLAMATRLGSVSSRMASHINLGSCYLEKGEAEAARFHLTAGLKLAAANRSQQMITAQTRLAELNLVEQAFSDAADLLKAAEQEALEKNDQASLGSIYGFQGLLSAELGHLEKGLTLVEKGIELDRTLGDTFHQGKNGRIQARILAKLGRNEETEAAFSQSHNLLNELDPYQTALTELRWGEWLLAQGDQARGRSLLDKALATFENLGANREIQLAQTFIKSEVE
ncbi:MAG: tetratricopeptide repeat protein [Chloroflexota bacterium]